MRAVGWFASRLSGRPSAWSSRGPCGWSSAGSSGVVFLRPVRVVFRQAAVGVVVRPPVRGVFLRSVGVVVRQAAVGVVVRQAAVGVVVRPAGGVVFRWPGRVAVGRAAGVAVAVGGEPDGGELVQHGPVDLPGHHRGDHRVAGGGLGGRPGQVHRPGPGRRAGGGPGPFQHRPAAQVVQVDVHGQVRRLAVPAGDHLPANQPLARFLDRIVAALRRGAGIFRARLLPQRLQHHRQRRRAGGGQVRVQPPGPAERGAQPQRPLLKPVAVPVRAGLGAVEHLPAQPRQIMLIRAAQHRRQQNPVRVRPEIFGELVRPVTDQPRQRGRELPGRQRRRDHRVRVEAAGPAGGCGGGALRDPGDRAQPGRGARSTRRPHTPAGR